MHRFEFAFDNKFRLPLLLLGVTPMTSHATITGDELIVRFGPWKLETPLSNITCHQVTEDYQWFKAIGPRGSFADRGVTFGTNTDKGVCVKFAEPVPGLVVGDIIKHPGATLTLADIDGFIAALDEAGVTSG